MVQGEYITGSLNYKESSFIQQDRKWLCSAARFYVCLTPRLAYFKTMYDAHVDSTYVLTGLAYVGEYARMRYS